MKRLIFKKLLFLFFTVVLVMTGFQKAGAQLPCEAVATFVGPEWLEFNAILTYPDDMQVIDVGYMCMPTYCNDCELDVQPTENWILLYVYVEEDEDMKYGHVYVFIDDNYGPARIGYLDIGGWVVPILQDGFY